MKTTFWVPIPAKAVPVQIAYEANDSLDLLERSVVRLLRLNAASASEIATSLGFSDLGGSSSDNALARRAGEEMIDSAIRELTDKGVVAPTDEDPERFRALKSLEDRSSDLHEGWAVYVPHNDFLLPTIVEGRKLPNSLPVEDAIVRTGDQPRLTTPAIAELSHMLLLLSARSPECWVADSDRFEETAGSPVFELGPRVRSVFLDRMGRSPRSVSCWAKLELLPASSGAAEIVLFEPQIHPTIAPLDGVPFSPRLRRWLEAEDKPLWAQIGNLSRETAEYFSAVLRMLRVDAETIDREIAEHRASRAPTLPIPSPLVIAGDSSLEAELAMAHKWLILSRRDQTLTTQVRDSYSRLVERLCGILGNIAEQDIHKWESKHNVSMLHPANARKLQRKFEREWERRLSQMGCDALPRSFKSRIRGAFKNVLNQSALPGAGQNLGRWLLPVVLLDGDAANAYGMPIAKMLRSEPAVFGLLDDLVKFRNAIAHNNPHNIPVTATKPTQLDFAFLKVVGVLAPNYP